MTNPIEETARVDDLHRNLLRWKGNITGALLLTDANGARHQYSTAEVENFVALLPKMRKRLESTSYAAIAWAERHRRDSDVIMFADTPMCPSRPLLLSRGLYLTREMALYKETEKAPEVAAPRCDCVGCGEPMCQLDAYRTAKNPGPLCEHCYVSRATRPFDNEPLAAPKPDPYTEHRLGMDDIFARERNDASDVRTGRRDRLVAALAAELVRPFEKRFPPESRLDRALPVTNGGRK